MCKARYRAYCTYRSKRHEDSIFKPHDHCIGPRRGRSLGAKTYERIAEVGYDFASFIITNGKGEMEEGKEGKGVGGEMGLGGTEWWPICAQRTEYKTVRSTL